MTITQVRERYARFASEETAGRSDLYQDWATQVADDPDLQRMIAQFDPQRRQPPLVFAVMRLAGAPEVTGDEWRQWALSHGDEILAAGNGRSVQTNEPLRCAAIMPALAGIAGPIALIEVGASAGLCLYPDRYSYEYSGVDVRWPARGGSAPVLRSEARGTFVPPMQPIEVVWRAGIDLNPLDATDPADCAWLDALVWPGEEGRRERIAAALDVVAADPPHLFTGDASQLLPDVIDAAPADATIVVTTPAVLPLVPFASRETIIAHAQNLADHWITLDQPTLHTAWTTPAPELDAGAFALARNGEILAGADPLGRWIRWLRP